MALLKTLKLPLIQSGLLYMLIFFQQAKDLQLGIILILVCVMFFVSNLPRLLLNLYELFNIDEIIECGENFFPPTWFICSTSVNHLLLVLNCIMNFVVYCCFNEKFKVILFQENHNKSGKATSPQQIPLRKVIEPKHRNIRVTGVIQTNIKENPSKLVYVLVCGQCEDGTTDFSKKFKTPFFARY